MAGEQSKHFRDLSARARGAIRFWVEEHQLWTPEDVPEEEYEIGPHPSIVAHATQRQMSKVPGCGRNTVVEIGAWLGRNGYTYRHEPLSPEEQQLIDQLREVDSSVRLAVRALVLAAYSREAQLKHAEQQIIRMKDSERESLLKPAEPDV